MIGEYKKNSPSGKLKRSIILNLQMFQKMLENPSWMDPMNEIQFIVIWNERKINFHLTVVEISWKIFPVWNEHALVIIICYSDWNLQYRHVIFSLCAGDCEEEEKWRKHRIVDECQERQIFTQKTQQRIIVISNMDELNEFLSVIRENLQDPCDSVSVKSLCYIKYVQLWFRLHRLIANWFYLDEDRWTHDDIGKTNIRLSAGPLESVASYSDTQVGSKQRCPAYTRQRLSGILTRWLQPKCPILYGIGNDEGNR